MSGDRTPLIGLALSGGGSRAIAFHLGCLRALHDRGLLEKVRVISSISGGSVIAAMYAYSDEPFETFDRRVVSLLRSGLVWKIARETLLTSLLPKAVWTNVTAGSAALACNVGRRCSGLLSAVGLSVFTRGQLMYAPLRRRASRTVALERVLANSIVGGHRMPQVARPNLDVVINATELRTQTAFRFGSRSSGSWRFGRIVDNSVSVAKAVSASAAFPVLLPALDEEFAFDLKGVQSKERVILTDGGVYDNLGVTCLEPGRSPDYSINAFPADYIICCDAGHGQPAGVNRPYWWSTRMQESFATTHRRVQTSTYARLHQQAEAGLIKGFILPYLGQQDDKLPHRPPDLVPRSQAMAYPTNFSPMSQANIDMLSRRGEQLTRLLIARYVPEL